MKRFHYLGIFVFVGLVLLLSACGTTITPPTQTSELWTEEEFGTYVENVGTKSSLATMVGQTTMVGQNSALASLAGIPANGPVGNLAALANPEALQNSNVTQAFLEALSTVGIANHGLSTANNGGYDVKYLPTGIWEYDKFKNTWNYHGHSDNLVVKFWWGNIPYNGSHTYITLTLDWDALSPTTVVTKGHEKLEVPTGLRIHFNKDGINAGHIDIKIDWYHSACGVITPEPSYVEVKGKFGHYGSDVAIDFAFTIFKEHRNDSNLVANFENDDFDTRIQSKGYVNVSIGNDSGKVYWDNVFKGYIFRDSNCVFTDLKIVYGEIKLGVNFTLHGQTDTLELQFTFDNIKKNQYGIQSIDLHKGKVLVNGYVVVHFEGTLDASGEKLMLTFADKTVSLAEFLGSYAGGWNLDLPVGMLGVLFGNYLGEVPSLPFF
jgi:hypothetical protein